MSQDRLFGDGGVKGVGPICKPCVSWPTAVGTAYFAVFSLNSWRADVVQIMV